MKSLKEKVHADIQRQQAEYEKTGRFYNNDIAFDDCYTLRDNLKEAADELFNSLPIPAGSKKMDQKRTDFKILLANLFNHQQRPVRVSLVSNDYIESPYKRASYFIIKIINMMEDMELIKVKRGNKIPNQQAFKTRIWTTEKLLSHFPEYRTGVAYQPIQLVEIWHKEKIYEGDKILKVKNLLPYPNTEAVEKIRKVLAKANEVNNRADISVTLSHRRIRLNTGLVAIFQDRLTNGGRLYTRGISGFQALNSDDREAISINGQPTIEIDFKGLHPNLLYAGEGIQYSQDPYSVVDDRKEFRPYLKAILLRMINCGNEYAAKKSADRWFSEQSKELRNQLYDLDVPDSLDLIKRFKEVHQPIAHHLCTSKMTGMRLMNKDARIAMDIIKYFTNQEIPILPMHDSFIIEEFYADELESIMQMMYQKNTKLPDHPDGFRIKTERKK